MVKTVYGIRGDDEARTASALADAFDAATEYRKVLLRRERVKNIAAELRSFEHALTSKIAGALEGTGVSITGVAVLPEENIDYELREGSFETATHLVYVVSVPGIAAVDFVDLITRALAAKFTPESVEPEERETSANFRAALDSEDFLESVRFCVKIPAKS